MMKKTKICTKCHIKKKLCEFSKCNSNKDRLQCWCKKCINEANRKNYYNNFKKRTKQIKEYQEQNKEKFIKYYKNYREKNRDKINKFHKENYQKNKKIILKNKKYMKKLNIKRIYYLKLENF